MEWKLKEVKVVIRRWLRSSDKRYRKAVVVYRRGLFYVDEKL